MVSIPFLSHDHQCNMYLYQLNKEEKASILHFLVKVKVSVVAVVVWIMHRCGQFSGQSTKNGDFGTTI